MRRVACRSTMRDWVKPFDRELRRAVRAGGMPGERRPEAVEAAGVDDHGCRWPRARAGRRGCRSTPRPSTPRTCAPTGRAEWRKLPPPDAGVVEEQVDVIGGMVREDRVAEGDGPPLVRHVRPLPRDPDAVGRSLCGRCAGSARVSALTSHMATDAPAVTSGRTAHGPSPCHHLLRPQACLRNDSIECPLDDAGDGQCGTVSAGRSAGRSVRDGQGNAGPDSSARSGREPRRRPMPPPRRVDDPLLRPRNRSASTPRASRTSMGSVFSHSAPTGARPAAAPADRTRRPARPRTGPVGVPRLAGLLQQHPRPPTAADIANSSAPTSTIRARKPCRCSSPPCQRAIP